MNKGELVDEVYGESGLTKKECREVVGSVVDKIAGAVAEGEEVRLVNFGTFKPSPRKKTVRFHPISGEEIDVPAKVVPKFSPGKGFKEAVGENLKVSKDGSGELEVEKA